MSFKSRTFATAFAVMALGAVVSSSAFAQTAGGGGRGGGGGGGDSGPTLMDSTFYAVVPNSRTRRFADPNWGVVEVRRRVDSSKECVTPTEGRQGRKAFTSSCGPL